MTLGSDATPIREIGYVNHCFPKLDIEAKPFAEITGHMPPDLSRHPHRLSFHHLMLVTAGRGTHRVDFESYNCETGSRDSRTSRSDPSVLLRRRV
jgi:hypothetical protein